MFGLLILSLLFLIAPPRNEAQSGHVTEEQYIKLHEDSKKILKAYKDLNLL